MLVQDIMTRQVEEISPQTSLRDAAARMRLLDVGALPVSEKDTVIGILTDRDIAIRAVAEGLDPSQTQAREAMTPDVVFCYQNDDIKEAVKIMEQKQIRRILVMDEKKRPAGIISLGDIAKRLADQLVSGEVLGRVSEPSMSAYA